MPKGLFSRAAAALAGFAVIGAANLFAPAQAEEIDYFQVDGVAYDGAVPAPEERFGFGLGDQPVRHDQMVAYLSEIANGSDRISVETIGYSHEGRPILFFVITSPENHARIDDIRAAHLASLEAGGAPTDGPSVVWLNFGVHGAESAGMDAAIPTVYHFAAAQGAEVEATLDEAVILVTAIFNPDGHSRRINHVLTYGAVNPVANPDHVQHDLWGEARVNHYWFDLNRQWLLQTQPESVAWMSAWHRWKPMVSADFHEMGTEATFYFHPGEPARRNPLIPVEARNLSSAIAQSHIAFLDGESRLYSSEEGFDNFYVGKGSTYPQVNGGVGILYEIGAARGGLIEADRGLVSHGENVRTHFRIALTTVSGALANADAIQAYQRNFFEESRASGESDRRRAFVFTAQGDPVRAAKFTRLLRNHDIDVYGLAADVDADGRTYRAGEAYVVPLAQDQYTMIQAAFDRFTDFPENIFYDVSGWTLPLAYDVEYAALGRRYSADLLGSIDAGAPAVTAPPRANYGYVFRWSDYYAPRALYRLLEEGVRVRVATEPVEIETSGGRLAFDRGAVFVPFVGQDVDLEDIHAMARTIAEEDSVSIHAVRSGSTPTPGADLGGRGSFRAVQEPRVLVLFDDGLARYDAGEAWHALDRRMHMEVTLRRKDDLGGIDWSRYTHIVSVGGNGALPDGVRDRLRQWIREEGGTYVAMRQSALWAEAALLGREAEDAEEDEGEGETIRLDYADRDVREAEHVIGGAIFATDIDPSHPLAYGMADRFLPVHRNTTLTLQRPEDDPYAVVAEYEDEPLLSGYASEMRLDEIAGTPAIIAQRSGRGAVILFADNPNFRATFLGTERIFLNSIFMSGLIDRAFGEYEEE